MKKQIALLFLSGLWAAGGLFAADYAVSIGVMRAEWARAGGPGTVASCGPASADSDLAQLYHKT